MFAPGQTPPYLAAQAPAPLVRDPVKSLCPDPLDFFLLPPRTPWYGYTDFLLLHRNASRNEDFQSLGEYGNGQIGNPVLSTRDLDFDFSSGGKVMVGHMLNECMSVEALYFGVNSWVETEGVRDNTTNALGGSGNLFSPFSNFGVSPISGFDFNNFAQIRYATGLQNFELNFRRQVPMRPERLTCSILFGVRYLQIPEEFDYLSTQTTTGPLAGSAVSEQVHTGNFAVGPQIGALFEFYVENRWWVNLEVKGALLYDQAAEATAYQNTSATGAPVLPQWSTTHQSNTSYLGDVDLTFVYRWTPNFSTRLGYQALWVDDVALASKNFSTNVLSLQNGGPAQLNHSGNVVYHGPHAGFMFNW